MRKATVAKAILLVALISCIWLAKPPAALAYYVYCGPMPSPYPNTPQNCQKLYSYCMCDCANQTAGPWGTPDWALCITACSAHVRGYGCQ